MDTVVIGSPVGENITIVPANVTDDGWMQAKVTICVECFTAEIYPHLQLNDVHAFSAQLKSLNSNRLGSAKLTPLEDQFSVCLEGDGKGHIEVTGHAFKEASYGSCLKFEFTIDQTFLAAIIHSIGEAT